MTAVSYVSYGHPENRERCLAADGGNFESRLKSMDRLKIPEKVKQTRKNLKTRNLIKSMDLARV
jgi:hypothetical protein